jgi:hypothetical protein
MSHLLFGAKTGVQHALPHVAFPGGAPAPVLRAAGRARAFVGSAWIRGAQLPSWAMLGHAQRDWRVDRF